MNAQIKPATHDEAIARWTDLVRDNAITPSGLYARDQLIVGANFPEALMWKAFFAGDHVEIGRLWADAIHARIEHEAFWMAEEATDFDVTPACAGPNAPRPLAQADGS